MDTFNNEDYGKPKLVLCYELRDYKNTLKYEPFDKEESYKTVSDFKTRILSVNIPFKRRQKIIAQYNKDMDKIRAQETTAKAANQELEEASKKEIALRKQLGELPESDYAYQEKQEALVVAIKNRIKKEQIFDKAEKKLKNLIKRMYNHVNQSVKPPFWFGLHVKLFKTIIFLLGIAISFIIALGIHEIFEFLLKKATKYEFSELESKVVLVLIFTLIEKYPISWIEKKIEVPADKWKVSAELNYLIRIVCS